MKKKIPKYQQGSIVPNFGPIQQQQFSTGAVAPVSLDFSNAIQGMHSMRRANAADKIRDLQIYGQYSDKVTQMQVLPGDVKILEGLKSNHGLDEDSMPNINTNEGIMEYAKRVQTLVNDVNTQHLLKRKSAYDNNLNQFMQIVTENPQLFDYDTVQNQLQSFESFADRPDSDFNSINTGTMFNETVLGNAARFEALKNSSRKQQSFNDMKAEAIRRAVAGDNTLMEKMIEFETRTKVKSPAIGKLGTISNDGTINPGTITNTSGKVTGVLFPSGAKMDIESIENAPKDLTFNLEDTANPTIRVRMGRDWKKDIKWLEDRGLLPKGLSEEELMNLPTYEKRGRKDFLTVPISGIQIPTASPTNIPIQDTPTNPFDEGIKNLKQQ